MTPSPRHPDAPTLRHSLSLRPATADDRGALVDLICLSTNFWYRASGRPAIFTAGPQACLLFPDVYEALDPGCCVVLADARTGGLAGSCFFHPRPTHVSLGIMNVHPNYFGQGVAGRLLRHITDLADERGVPTRLVSSAMNLDSYSLYTRAGFTPRAVYQDMLVPPDRVRGGLGVETAGVTEATPADLPDLVALEARVSHIRREQDWRHFLENQAGIWHVSVHRDAAGRIDGVLASVNHPGSHIIGPGVMADDAVAIRLLAAELAHHARVRPDASPLLLIPADCPALVKQVYQWGGKNIELHVHQVRGAFTPFDGVAIPTFMPESA